MNASTPDTLDATTRKQSSDIIRHATNNSANSEYGNGKCKADRTTDDIANGTDNRHSDGIDQEIRRAYPEGFSG